MERHFMCVTGVDKHMIEKDLTKFLRRMLKTELLDGEDIPVRAIAKKRNNTFAFLQFESYD